MRAFSSWTQVRAFGPMCHAAQKTQPLRNAVTVLANVFLGGLGIQANKRVKVVELGEDVGGVPKFWNFNNDRVFKLHDVLGAKQIRFAGALAELIVEEQV